jgi:hypothetical protein
MNARAYSSPCARGSGDSAEEPKMRGHVRERGRGNRTRSSMSAIREQESENANGTRFKPKENEKRRSNAHVSFQK